MKTTAERMRAMRERRIAAGLTELRLWSHPDDEPLIRRYASQLARRRKKNSTTTATTQDNT